MRRILICETEAIREVHRKRYKGREYKWIVRRITLPKDFPEDEKYIVLTYSDFMKIVEILRKRINGEKNE